MDSRYPDELIEEVKQEQETRSELAVEALQWFLDDTVGQLFPRGDVVDRLSNEFDITNRQANTAISDTVGDIVDPVQQIVKGNKKYVGVIDYKIFNDEGAYGYVDFDDRKGQRKRVVCARCVEKHIYDENINHATQGEGSSDVDASWQQLLNKVTSHYATQHTTSPSTIEPGASLVSGTTISGNTAFHAGNESNVDHNNLSNRTHSGDNLTPSSVSSDTLEADSITDGADVSHSNELADAADVSPIQSSSDITVTDTQVGTVNNGEFLQNSGGSLTGGTVQTGSNIPAWQEDGNSPAQPRDGFGEITLSDNYKAIKMIVTMTGTETTAFSIRVNDIQSDYKYRSASGSLVSSKSSFAEAIANARGQVLHMTGEAYWPTDDDTGVVGISTNLPRTDLGCRYGRNNTINDDYVNKITFTAFGGDGDLDIRVYGLK